jgi:hypothetical protein
MIYPQSYFLRRVRYKSWIISLNAVCALRPADTVTPPRAHRAEDLLHKNGSFMRTRLRGSPTLTPQPLRHRIMFNNDSSQRRLFPVAWKHQLKRVESLLTYLYVIGRHR